MSDGEHVCPDEDCWYHGPKDQPASDLEVMLLWAIYAAALIARGQYRHAWRTTRVEWRRDVSALRRYLLDRGMSA